MQLISGSNTLFRVTLDERLRQSLFNFLRRAQFAFREYAPAREQTATYLRSVDAVSTYFVAIGHWEVFLAYAYQAFELLTRTEKRALTRRATAPSFSARASSTTGQST
jgi:hypothetical protein